MEIRNISFSRTKKHTVLWSEVKNTITDEVLYFAVNRKYEKFINKDASAFLAGLFLAMAKTGQVISVAETVSAQLLRDLKTANRFLRRKDFGFRTARVLTKVSRTKAKGKQTACFFSGDIESTLQFLNRSQKKQNITHLVYIRGFNHSQDGDGTFIKVRRMAQARHLELVVVRTNIRDITDPIADWSFSSVGALGAVGFLLRDGFKRVLVPSSNRKVSSVMEKSWLSQTVQTIGMQKTYPKSLLWKVRSFIRDLDARYNRYRLYKFLARTGLLRRKQELATI